MRFNSEADQPKHSRASRGVTIRRLLVALICLPVVGVGIYGGKAVASGISAANAASDQERTIRLVVQIDTARSAAQNLIVPGEASSAAKDHNVVTDFGISPGALAFAAKIYPAAAVEAAEANVVRQLAAIDRQATPPRLDAAIAAELDAARAAVADADRPAAQLEDYTGQVAKLSELGRAETQLTDRLLTNAHAADGVREVQQLQVVVQLVTAAQAETPGYLTMALSQGTRTAYYTGYLRTWASYQAAAASATDDLQGDLARSWAKLQGATTSTSYDSFVDPTSSSVMVTPSLNQLLQFGLNSEARSNALDDLVQQAVDDALGAAASHRAAARSAMWTTVGDTGGLIVASLVLAVLAGLAVSRPLRRLADRADQIRDGELVEVTPAGPAEVRRVGEALAATSASLRRIEAQATEVAAGHLDSPLLSEPLPGRLGTAVHDSITRITQAIRQREALQSELAHQAAHDPLTTLPNRAAALHLIEAALARSHRAGHLLGLLFVDLDGFKAINDSYGHAAGDRTLQTAAERMTACVRAGDVVCRLGGDEFVIVVEDTDTDMAVVHTGQRIVDAISAPITLDATTEVTVGASVGVAISTDNLSNADSLLAEADAAVYRAKSTGRGRVEIFDRKLRASLRHRAELEGAIRTGITNNEFTLHYQPVVEIATGTTTSYEALIRWHRPGHGMVMPGDFIPVAESSGLINDLGRWVLHAATAQLAEWTTNLTPGTPPPSIAINVSGRQLANPALVDDVANALTASGINPTQLTIELTESVLVADPAHIDRLHALKALGVRIALDDFGTGYTSIGQLGNFPLDTLKIDRSFTATLATTDKLVQTMIQVAHLFSLNVIAEGVEDPTQLDVLRTLDCDHVQGYLLARPKPPSALPSDGVGTEVSQPA